MFPSRSASDLAGGCACPCILAAAVASLPNAASAWVAPQITPESFAAPIQGGVGASPGLDMPSGADELFGTLRGVRREGGVPQLAADARRCAPGC